ncbi:MAG: divergent polysaccharide deacetylase family protein, partial [Rhodospirillaceae bacterium]|nr:divergent polysaccharide deacetylase family protein [Rhodospirillaceae bacterium]
ALPPEVSLSFDPASAELEDWIAAARAYGHEALIDLHLGTTESLEAAPADAGESRLLAELGPQENLRRLDATLARAPKAAGVAISITDAFLGDAAALTPILERLQAGGWIAVGLPVTAPLTVAADRVFPDQVAANALARDAMALRTLARQRGAALAIGPAEVAIGLAEDLARVGASEIVLVPASALVEN